MNSREQAQRQPLSDVFIVLYARRRPKRTGSNRYVPSPLHTRWIAAIAAPTRESAWRRMRGAAARYLGIRPMRAGDILLQATAMRWMHVKQARRGWFTVDLEAELAAAGGPVDISCLNLPPDYDSFLKMTSRSER